MNRRLIYAAIGLAIGLIGLIAGCSSGNESREPQGSFAITMAASGPAAGADDPLSRFKAAVITIAGIEARMADGTWVPIDSGLPADVDLIAIMAAGNVATLPSDLLPAGDYVALELRITALYLTLLNDSTLEIAPPGTGWNVRVPVNFSVASGQATVVHLTLRGPGSFKFFDGEYGFDPEVDVVGVERD